MKTLTIGDLKPRFPIIQGGMGVGISLSGLASAVANEGGIGVISAAGLGLLYKKLSPNYTEAGNLGLAEEIRKAREKAKGIIGVNVMVALSDFAELVKTSIAEKVDIIFSGAGLPLDLPSFLKKDSVTKLVPIVSSARAVRIICENGRTTTTIFPMPLYWKARRPEVTSVTRKTSWRTNIFHWKSCCPRWYTKFLCSKRNTTRESR